MYLVSVSASVDIAKNKYISNSCKRQPSSKPHAHAACHIGRFDCGIQQQQFVYVRREEQNKTEINYYHQIQLY